MTEDEAELLQRYRAAAENTGALFDALLAEFHEWVALCFESTDLELRARLLERLLALRTRLDERAVRAFEVAPGSQTEHRSEFLN
jgi:hypothetical protein